MKFALPRVTLGGALLSALLLAACQSPEVAMVSTGPAAGSVVLHPSLALGSHVQARVVPYTTASIEKLWLIPYEEVSPGVFRALDKVTGQATDSTDVQALRHLAWSGAAFDPDRPFVLSNLKRNTNYRIVARAATGADTLISDDASSSVDVAVANDDRPTIARLPIQLKDVVFSGTAEVTLLRTGEKTYDHLTLLLEELPGAGAPVSIRTITIDAAYGGSLLLLEGLRPDTSYRLTLRVKDASDHDLTAPFALPFDVTDDDAIQLDFPFTAPADH